MDYQEVKEVLEALKITLMKKIEDPNLSKEEKRNIQYSIYNYDYIIELTDMNHFQRGLSIL
jgi:hypothetical protein